MRQPASRSTRYRVPGPVFSSYLAQLDDRQGLEVALACIPLATVPATRVSGVISTPGRMPPIFGPRALAAVSARTFSLKGLA